MLESIVASLLNRVLGSYVQNFDPKQLNIGIWSGDVKLRNLSLKKEALDKLELPINVHSGYLGQLTLQIPWSNLRNEPVKVIVEDVYLLIEPTNDERYNSEEEERRAQAVKQENLATLDIITKNQESATYSENHSNDLANENFQTTLITKIIDNLQIQIKNIHIRFEEFSNLTPNPFAIGIILKELSAVSTNDSWETSFIQISKALTFKLITLTEFSIYWNTDTKSLKQNIETPEEMLQVFREYISNSSSSSISNDNSNDNEIQYIVNPVSGIGKITLNKAGSTPENPKTSTNLSFGVIDIELDSNQYRDALWMANQFHLYQKIKKFRKFRPSVKPNEDPKAWMLYTIKVILNKVHETRYKWTWEFFKKRRDNRKEYIKIYKKKYVDEKSMTIDEKKSFENLEKILDFEDIRFYRSLTRAELKKEKLLQPRVQQIQQNSSWSSWIWGTKDDSNSITDSETGENNEKSIATENETLSEEQRKELFEAIDFDEQALIESVDLPKDRVIFNMILSLSRGSFKLKKSSSLSPTNSNNAFITELVFDDFKAFFKQRPDSFLSECSLQEFRVEDGTENSIYPHVVSVKSIHSDMHDPTKSSSSSINEEPFFYASFEKNPMNSIANYSLFSKMKSITVFYHISYIKEVYKFFKPLKSHQETIDAIMNVTEATIDDFKNQTRIGLEYALQEHQTIDLNLDLQAPLFILPIDPTTWNSPCGIIDSGHINVVSKLADPKLKEDINSKNSINKEDWNKLNSLMYDQFNITLEDTQILIGPTIKSTVSELHSHDIQSNERSSYVLDRLNISFLAELSIVPSSKELPRFKVSANVPRFCASMSDAKYKVMMQLLTSVIPDFDDFDNEIRNKDANSDELNLADLIDDSYSSDETSINEHDDDQQSAITTNTNNTSKSTIIQKLLAFNFSVDEVQLSLYKCTDKKTFKQSRLVDLRASNLELEFAKIGPDMEVDMTLKSLEIEDFIDPTMPPEFRMLATSLNKSFITNKENDDQFKLFTVHYTRKQRMALTEEGIIELFDQSVDLKISDILVVVTRTSILTIIDFCLTTFVSNDAPPKLIETDEHSDLPQRIDVMIEMNSITLILNDDGIKLATIKLSSADVDVLLAGGTMKVKMNLGALTLHDEVNEGVDRDSVLRKLISIEGDNLADIRYETMDAANTKTEDLFTMVYFHSESIRFNFIEEPYKKLLNFLSNLLQLKAIFDSARRISLNQVEEEGGKMKFDILIKSPIVVFPKFNIETEKYDKITAHLGEMYAKNDYVYHDIENNKCLINLMEFGFRSTRLTSTFNYPNNIEQHVEIIDKLDMDFKLSSFDEGKKFNRPMMVMKGSMPDIEMNLTEIQARYLLSLIKTVPFVFITPSQDSKDLEVKRNELNIEANTPGDIDPNYTKITFKFLANKIALKIFVDTTNTSDISEKGLSLFSLNETSIQLQMKDDGNYSADIQAKSFTVEDVRRIGDNKFTDIVHPIHEDNYQFMSSIKTTGKDPNRKMNFSLSVDSPRTYLVLDYLFGLKSFVDVALFSDQLQTNSTAKVLTDLPKAGENESIANTSKLQIQKSTTTNSKQKESSDDDEEEGSNIAYSINVVDAFVIVLANPEDENTEAIVFKFDQFLLSSLKVLNISGNNIGMFLCRMKSFNDQRLRLLDDFSFSSLIDTRNSTSTKLLTKINIAVEPLVLRLSFRDIQLVLSILQKVTNLYNNDDDDNTENDDNQMQQLTFPSRFKDGVARYAKSISSVGSTVNSNPNNNNILDNDDIPDAEILIKDETFCADMQGMRLVIIGTIHELPMIDMRVRPFTVGAKNWSNDLEVDSDLIMFVNIFNYSKSAWEPFIEPWTLGAHVSRIKETLSLDLVSRKNVEVTVTSYSLSLFSEIISQMNYSSDDLVKPRGEESPYRIRNQTGFKIKIWIDLKGQDSRLNLTELEDDEEIPWRFEDWREIREKLDTDNQRTILGVELLDTQYSSINGISVTGEGEELYTLKPKKNNKYYDRLLCTVNLGEDYVKRITLGSSFRIANETQIPIMIGVHIFEDDYRRECIINPGDSRSVPIEFVYSSEIFMKPVPKRDINFDWSVDGIQWKEIEKDTNSIPLICPSLTKHDKTLFNFQIHVANNLTPETYSSTIYPNLRLVVTSPLEIINTLPFDLRYKIYDTHLKKDWASFLSNGKSSQIHVVRLSHVLMLTIELPNSGFNQTDFAVINAPRGTNHKREITLHTENNETGQKLTIRLNYETNEKEGRGIKIYISSPFLILNKTGLELKLTSNKNLARNATRNNNTLVSKVSSIYDTETNGSIKKALPSMFSFDVNDTNRRALLKVGDSEWSKPISLDAIGSSFNVAMNSSTKQREINAGVSVNEGVGIYRFSKMVTISPRFVLKNKLSETIHIVENNDDDNEPFILDPNDLMSLKFIRSTKEKTIFLGFPTNKNNNPNKSKIIWSSAFSINDIGKTYLRVRRQLPQSKRIITTLLLINVLLEDATLFIHIEDAKDQWPYSIRNYSDIDIIYYQSDSILDSSSSSNSNSNSTLALKHNYKPIKYMVPGKSSMSYSWDYPASSKKELILQIGKSKRRIQLAEIGTLLPMKCIDSKGAMKILEFNVSVEGSVQILYISEYNSEFNLYQLTEQYRSSNKSLASSIDNEQFEIDDSDDPIKTRFLINFETIGISIINSNLKELCYITLKGTELKYIESKIYQNYSIKLKWLQIDNQLFNGIYPIVLYPTIIPKNGKSMDLHPCISSSISIVKDESHGVIFVKYATILLQEMALDLDEDFLLALIEFASQTGSFFTKQKIEDESLPNFENLVIPEPLKTSNGLNIYFEALHIQPIQIDLSFMRTHAVNSDNIQFLSLSSISGPLIFIFDMFSMAIGNINDAPVRLNALFMENVKVPIPILLQSITTHYSQESIYQVHKILGSADFIGNPVGLFSNISSGVMDIFYQPYQGFIMNDRPQELGIGLAKGGLSFVKKSVFGISDSISRLTGSAAKGLSVATMDKRYQEKRRLVQNRNRPVHALYGITQGATSFAENLASGIAGIALSPMRGVAEEGAAGFFKGLGKGVIGLPTKTAIGLLDMASSVSEGVRNTTTVFDQGALERVRLTRYVGHDGVIKPYSHREAQGQFWLKTVNGGNFAKEEEYIAHVCLPGDEKAIIVTFRRLMLVSLGKMNTRWVISYPQIRSITLEKGGITIGLKGGKQGPFIPIPDEASKRFLYNKIGIAVNKINK